MNQRHIIGGIVLVLIVVGVFVAANSKSPSKQTGENATSTSSNTEGVGSNTDTKPVNSTTKPATTNSAAQTQPERTASGALIVRYTSTGFSPLVAKVKQGESVRFINAAQGSMLVASNNHPLHDILPGFEQSKTVGRGGTFDYTFTQQGVWGYHNHSFPSHQGSVVVE